MITAVNRVFASPRPIDLRKGFNGLLGLAQALGIELGAGDLLLATNASRTACKLLYTEPNGLVLLHKRLTSGRFPSLAARVEGEVLHLSPAELRLFLDGCQLLALFDMKTR